VIEIHQGTGDLSGGLLSGKRRARQAQPRSTAVCRSIAPCGDGLTGLRFSCAATMAVASQRAQIYPASAASACQEPSSNDPAAGRAIAQAQVDRGLVWDTCILGQSAKIVNGGCIESDGDPGLKPLGVRIPSRLRKIVLVSCDLIDSYEARLKSMGPKP